MFASELAKGPDEHAAGASRLSAEEAAEGHLELDLVPESGNIGELAGVSTVNTPALAAAEGAGRIGEGGRDAESQGRAIEVGPDQAATGRDAQQLRQEQKGPQQGAGVRWGRRRSVLNLRSGIIKSAGEPLLRDHFQPRPASPANTARRRA